MVYAQQAVSPITVYYQMETSNKSFLDMHFFLKSKGIKNNKFFLVLYDSDLAGVDPRDPRLSLMMKQKVLREVSINFWYFIREVVRIPDQGGTVGGGKRYQLHRGNLALNFGFILNWNMFLELPRQQGKTISALCWYLWVFNYGTTNSECMFMNKKHEDSKMNLQRLKDIRSSLPEYLRFDTVYTPDGKSKKAPGDNAESLSNPHTANNKIVTKPGARNKASANSIGRGCTQPQHWYDEYAFILHNRIIYGSATPSFSTASDNAKANGAPYGILITTTPGDLTTDEGVDAYETKNNATPFNEKVYDFTMDELNQYIAANTDSSFVYIRFTYIQLGKGDDYFRRMCIELKKDWPTIRREVLLEWAVSASNSPFTQQDLEIVKGLVKEPISQIVLNHNFFMNIYKPMTSRRYPPIIGVDVSGGFEKDSSTIVVIDSKTTELVADFNCNYISPPDLAKCIYELVMSYMPNAIVNIERNGGYGASVISILKRSKIKRNLYYEYKDRVTEERPLGYKMGRRTKTVKVYGFDETKQSRALLMEILKQRMQNHKAKFISPLLYNELCTLEVKKNGRIEHASNAHDDTVFGYLLALYVWYEGKDLMEHFGLEKNTISTDDDETIEDGFNEEYVDIVRNMDVIEDPELKKALKYLEESTKSMSYNEYIQMQMKEDEEITNRMIASNPKFRQAYAERHHLDIDELQDSHSMIDLPPSVFLGTFDNYGNRIDGSDDIRSQLQQQFDKITDLR